jgi:23S rRNA (cytidine1920-2'-O)/16S rRNA (cytidine1409-2'-O)-methyltransferase
MSASEPSTYVSRGGLKLEAALDAFQINPTAMRCADLGCNVGGFTDCLLQRGAVHVFAIDTGYGALAWKLRQDDRVTVLERTNALHYEPAVELPDFAPCDLAVIDLGWTRQQHAIAAARKWLRPGGTIITLIKPHYESDTPRGKGTAKGGILDDTQAEAVKDRVLTELPTLGVAVKGCIISPIRGGKGKGKVGNVEYLACCVVW